MAQSTSMSTLGAFYEALYDVANDQKQKYGPNAVPDLVPGAVTDNIADGIITTAAGLVGLDNIAAGISKSLPGKLSVKFGLGDPNLTGYKVENPLHVKKMKGSFIDQYGNTAFTPVETYDLSVQINPTTINAALIDSNAFADGLVDTYWDNRKAIQKLELIRSLGGKEKLGGSSFIKNRIIKKIDSDIATAVAVAEQTIVESNTSMSRLKANARKVISGEGRVLNNILSEGARSASLSTAMAMHSGIANKKDRDDFTSFYEKNLKEEILDEYNLSIRGTTYKPIKSFNELFVDKGKAIDKTMPILFDPMTHMGRGDLLQNAYQSVLGRRALDVSLDAAHPNLRRHLNNMYYQANDNSKFETMIRSMSHGVGKNGKTSKMVSLGAKELRDAHLGTPGLSKTQKRNLEALKTIRRGLDDESSVSGQPSNARFRLANNLAYASYRWDSMPTISKIFTPYNAITGTLWKNMANLSGGLFGHGTYRSNAYVEEKYSKFGITRKRNKYGLDVGKTSKLTQDKLNSLRKDSRKLRLKIRAEELRKGTLILAKDIAESEKKLKAMNANLQKVTKERSHTLKKEFELHDQKLGGYGFLRGVELLDHKANFMQKTFYKMYVYSPGAFIGGLANGDTFQRMLHVGTGFGKNINDKSKWKFSARFADKMLRNKVFQTIMKINGAIAWVRDAPLRLATAAANYVKDKLKQAMIALAKKLINETILAALAIATAGITKVIGWAYKIVNFLTFGLLDKAARATMKILMQLIVGLIGGIILSAMLGIGNLFEGAQTLASNLGNGGTFAPDPGYVPSVVEANNDDPFRNVGPIIGDPGIDPNPIYNGTCQAIYDSVKTEFPPKVSGVPLNIVPPVTRYCGTNAFTNWCDACQGFTVTCTNNDIIPLCSSSPAAAGNLFRHELTHHMCGTGGLGSSKLSEFCSEVVGFNGGGYSFSVSYDSGNHYATEIAGWLAANKGISSENLKKVCFCDASAKSQYLSIIDSVVTGIN